MYDDSQKGCVECWLPMTLRGTTSPATNVPIKRLMGLPLIAVTYTIAGATSMQFIAETSCNWQGITSGCLHSQLTMTAIFSSVQLLLKCVRCAPERSGARVFWVQRQSLGF